MSEQSARSRAEELHAKLGTAKPGIDLDAILVHLKLRLIQSDLGDEVASMLIRTPTHGNVVCMNSTMPKPRKLIAIAHQVGHFYLQHRFKPGEYVHIDKMDTVFSRHKGVLEREGKQEAEAQQFATALLMPQSPVLDQVNKHMPLNELSVTKIAEAFGVSETAMTLRLKQLRFL